MGEEKGRTRRSEWGKGGEMSGMGNELEKSKGGRSIGVETIHHVWSE